MKFLYESTKKIATFFFPHFVLLGFWYPLLYLGLENEMWGVVFVSCALRGQGIT